MLVEDKTINILCWVAIIMLYISAITNNDLIMCVLANQLLIIILLLKICEKVEEWGIKMSDEIIHKIERIDKMLYMLLNEEQKEEINQFDIKHHELKLKELEKLKHIGSDSLERQIDSAVYASTGVNNRL